MLFDLDVDVDRQWLKATIFNKKMNRNTIAEKKIKFT